MVLLAPKRAGDETLRAALQPLLGKIAPVASIASIRGRGGSRKRDRAGKRHALREPCEGDPVAIGSWRRSVPAGQRASGILAKGPRLSRGTIREKRHDGEIY
jgi:hypothetical protein